VIAISMALVVQTTSGGKGARLECAMQAMTSPVDLSSPRPDAPPNRLRSVAEALDQLLDSVAAITDVESVDTAAARGRVLATPLRSRLDVPAADNSQMDGYAVRAAELAGARTGDPIDLPVSQRIPAGHAARPLQIGSVARIFTGALMPAGADAVVMQEAAVVDAASGRVSFTEAPVPGTWIRRRGEDVRCGHTILEAGTRLGPQHLGLAASIGTAQVSVVRRPRVAIFSTGDELAMPGEVAIEDLKVGALYNSNRFTLRGLIETLGCEVVDLGIVPDTLAATREALVRAADGSDVIVTSGGVSVGEEDHMRPAVSAEGSIDLWQIALKPGKPLAFGRVRESLFVGLPGNPVSSFVTFLIFVRPLLLRLQGIVDVKPPAYLVRADFEWNKPDKRQEFLRVRLNTNHGLDLFPQQGSAVLTSTTWADGLLDNPAGQRIARGDLVRFMPFGGLLG
jgi:molybdopterin molybdotransferase